MRSDIELLRIISAFAIVWFHSGYQVGHEIAYAGLVVFLIVSTYFATKSEKNNLIQDRALRLIVPCIVWSLLYASLQIIRGAPVFPSNYNIISKVLSTPSIHLWYLPFIFFCIISIDKIKKHITPTTLAIITAIAISILLLSSYQWRQWTLVSPFNQYLHALPAVLMGIFLASCSQLTSILKYGLIVLISIATLYVFSMDIRDVSITYLVGISAGFLLLKTKSALPHIDAITQISKLTFGIYLLHPLILFILRHLGVNSILLPILGFIISALSIYIAFKVIPKPILKYIM